MLLHSDTLSCFRANQVLLLLHNATCLVEKQFDPTGLKPTIYCTLGKHANHYTTDAVCGHEYQLYALII